MAAPTLTQYNYFLMPKTNLDKLLKPYDYHLPPELIAQKPASPRDNARLLVYSIKKKTVNFDTFKNIVRYLPKNAVLVLNETKVIPARLMVKKETGGRAEILYIGHDRNSVKVIANRKLNIGQHLTIEETKLKPVLFKVIAKKDNFYFLKPNFPAPNIQLILQEFGKTPLPPYIKHSPLSEKQKREQYQTVFAKTGESVAAPTASLHFTKALLKNLQKQGITIKYVNLNVGLGTFAKLKEENLKTGTLHTETYGISNKTFQEILTAKKQKRPIIAVGTTAVRTLESAYRTGKLNSSTNLFIKPPYKFGLADGLITNFHVPKSSLLMLVASLVGRKQLFDIYKKAINKKLKFFSFGDGMLIIP